MGRMKELAEELSVAIGGDGEITDEVLALGQKMLDAGICVRLARDEDIDEVCRLVSLLSPEAHDYTNAHKKYRDKIQGNPDYFLWVAQWLGPLRSDFHPDDRNVIVGTGMMHFQHKLSYRCGTAAHLEDVVVDPVYRGVGIGEIILQTAIAAATLEDCYKVMLTCYDKTAEYYERFGFVRHDIGMRLSLKEEY